MTGLVRSQKADLRTIFVSFLTLGCVAFGGPVAHLAFFQQEFVEKRAWFSKDEYAEIVALCQFLPGPASSQVGISIGLLKGGYSGAVLAWFAFTLPSALLLFGVAMALVYGSEQIPKLVLLSLKAVTVAVVVNAVWGMASSICHDAGRKTIAVIAACAVLWFEYSATPIILIVLSGVFGAIVYQRECVPKTTMVQFGASRKTGFIFLLTFVLLLVFLPILATMFSHTELTLFSSFFQVGSLVFGGGHVVLPMLEAEVLDKAWMSRETFLVGYGATQAVPGPLFTFATFIGAVSPLGISALTGALIATIGIFLPSFLLVFGVMPLWQSTRTKSVFRGALAAINASVVGLLLAALYRPVFTAGVQDADNPVLQLIIVLVAWLALAVWKLPPWLVVLSAVGFAYVFSFI
ncbi:chromate efflux transporter [Alteromonas sp. W364]|uniref:chromate efflux transporter n=1 Tax=Alteromonas sp. W364 TaxID=3075610 RepID=UPI00288389E1|nr:chromate efflux transporter [Alteromonas sp. W364]MDT0629424.1 chromate efflux transporter [Alteromonas sp. W364]